MPTRPDPVDLLVGPDVDISPERRAARARRLAASPLGFYRGSAALMAHDLARQPTSGITVQLNGDATLANFGLYSDGAGGLTFDLRTFDHTGPGPWEWDVARLATDLVVVGRANGFARTQRRRALTRLVRRYRRSLQEFAIMSALELSGEHGDADELRRQYEFGRIAARLVAPRTTARSVGTTGTLPEPENADGDLARRAHVFLEVCARGMAPAGRELVAAHELVSVTRLPDPDAPRETRALLLRLSDRRTGDPLSLRATAARPSALQGISGLPPAPGPQAERIVRGQRLTQVFADPVLSWAPFTDGSAGGHDLPDCYLRQEREQLIPAGVVRMSSFTLAGYAELCAWTLAHAHARTGDRLALAEHLAGDPDLEQRLDDLAEAGADRNERSHRRVAAALEDRAPALAAAH